MDIPLLTADAYALNNFVTFIAMHEAELIEYGALKIHPKQNCELALKKRKTSPISVLVQRAKQVHESELIYTIYKRDRSDLPPDSKALPIPDENSFWYTLSHSKTKAFQSDIILLPNKSLFYEKWHRRYFTTYQLPRQSLLTLGTNSLVHHCVPTLAQAHGPGAIFPLAVARYGLPLFVYHHGGGVRHWYIIRGEHREALLKLFQECHGAQCIQHDALFVDPSVFKKYSIPYRHIVQQPNEILVLNAGIIAQSFTTDVHWSESIPFGLPGWIRNGHARAIGSLCRCDSQAFTKSEPIDLNPFSEDRISQYIGKQIDDFQNMALRFSPNDIRTPQPQPTPLSTEFLSPTSPRSIENHSTPKNHEAQSKKENTSAKEDYDVDAMLEYLQNQETDIIDTIESADRNCFDEYWLPPVNDISDPSSSQYLNLPSIKIYREPNMNTPDASSSSSRLSDAESDFCVEICDESSNQSKSSTETSTTSKFNRKESQSKKNNNDDDLPTALFVSGLKYNVTKADLYKQFLGVIKVILKPCLNVPHLKCAFIVHRTRKQAQRNLRRRIDYKLLGRECFIQYACMNQSSPSNDSYRVANERTITVTNIPTNVSKSELNSIFDKGTVMKYCTMRSSSRRRKDDSDFEIAELPSGMAFIVFNTEKDAADVIQKADQYQIKGQRLGLSVMNETKQL